MDEPSRSPYRLDLDNGPVLGIGPDPKIERDSAVSVSLSSRQELTFSSGERTLGFGPVAQAVRAHA
jgi:hypothetical protein